MLWGPTTFTVTCVMAKCEILEHKLGGTKITVVKWTLVLSHLTVCTYRGDMEALWCHKYQVSPISWLCHLESSPLCKMLCHGIAARGERDEDKECYFLLQKLLMAAWLPRSPDLLKGLCLAARESGKCNLQLRSINSEIICFMRGR